MQCIIWTKRIGINNVDSFTAHVDACKTHDHRTVATFDDGVQLSLESPLFVGSFWYALQHLFAERNMQVSHHLFLIFISNTIFQVDLTSLPAFLTTNTSMRVPCWRKVQLPSESSGQGIIHIPLFGAHGNTLGVLAVQPT